MIPRPARQLWPALFCTLLLSSPLAAQSDWTPIAPRSALVECYFHSDREDEKRQLATLEAFAKERGGIRVVPRDLANNRKNRERLDQILKHYKLPPDAQPAIYGCNQVILNIEDEDSIQRQLDQMFRYEVFSRAGCHRCDEAKELLPKFLEQYPAFRLRIRSIDVEPGALADLNKLLEREPHGGASTPAMHVCNQLLIGFDRTNATPARLHKTLSRWTVPTTPESSPDTPQVSEVTDRAPF